MALLHPRSQRPTAKQPAILSCGCPLVRYRSSWCMGLCQPIQGVGMCGRMAPHAQLGKTQRAILQFKNGGQGVLESEWEPTPR